MAELGWNGLLSAAHLSSGATKAPRRQFELFLSSGNTCVVLIRISGELFI